MDLKTDPQAWVECSECETAWVLRRCMSLSQGWIWVWQPDCKCKKADPRLAGPDGPLELVDANDPKRGVLATLKGKGNNAK